MDTLYENTDIWKLMFKYLDYESRINLNRVYKTAVVRKFTKKELEAHHGASISWEVYKFFRLALALHNDEAVTRGLVQLIRPRYSVLLHSKRIRDKAIAKCNEFIPQVSEEYATVLRKTLEVAMSKTEDYGDPKKLIIS